MKSNYCVYTHKRKTDGVIFYVGKGSIKRSRDKNYRNEHWHNTVNKHGYVIEIISKNLSESEAFELEKKLISFYGRKDKGLGPLVNWSDGGEGVSGLIHNDEYKINMRNIHAEKTGCKVFLYHLYNDSVLVFNSKRECSRFLVDKNHLKGRIKGDKTLIDGKYLVSFNELSDVEKKQIIDNRYLFKVSENDVKYIRENYIPHHNEFGIRGLSRKFNIGHSSIRSIITRRTWKHID
jgi:hypothetical protein